MGKDVKRLKDKQTSDLEFDGLADYHAQPRYDIGLQQLDNLCCYKDFYHTNVLSEAKEEADKAASETGRATIVYDRKEFSIVYRVAALNQPKQDKPPTPIVVKRGVVKRK